MGTDKFDRHINKGKDIEIGGDTFTIKSAGLKQVAKPYFTLMRAFKDSKEGADASDMLKNFTDDTVEAINILVMETLKVSYPDMDEGKLEVFAMKHLMELMMPVMELYMPQTKDVEKLKKMEQFQKLRAGKSDTGKTSPTEQA